MQSNTTKEKIEEAEEFYQQLVEEQKKFSKILAERERKLALARAAYLNKFQGAGEFEILDEVFNCFIATNERKGKHWSWDDIITIETEHPRYFTFKHDEIKYLATVVRVDSPSNGEWLNIKLVNNGFVYIQRSGRGVFRGQLNDDWIVLDQSTGYRYFQHLRAQTPDYGQVKVYYSADHRLDIKLYTNNPNRPNLQITFEDGYPYEEGDEVPEPILQPGESLTLSYAVTNVSTSL